MKTASVQSPLVLLPLSSVLSPGMSTCPTASSPGSEGPQHTVPLMFSAVMEHMEQLELTQSHDLEDNPYPLRCSEKSGVSHW